MIDLSRITKKFPHYQSQEAMQQEHERTQYLMEEFLAAMYDDVLLVRAAGWTFSVFWIRDDIKTLHCGLYGCCNMPLRPGPPEIREELESKIYRRLPYDRIIWEI
jgi:hypothetical protein